MDKIKLSVIMPVYNVESTIELALNSILMQVVDFEYEIIAVDDCSTDKTLEILENYAQKFPQIKIIRHKENQGNSVAFYDALSKSCGDYFCVLDGDDYYTVKNKLQKQVDFLDSDKNEDYVAVTHKYLRVNNEGKIRKDRQLTLKEREHDYYDFLRQNFYYHTATYMYRNIFRGNVPECFKEEIMRGDNPRTFMHVSTTKGKVKFLDFVGSVYSYSEGGIWSKMTPEAQKLRNIRMFEYQKKSLHSELEKNKWEKICKIRKEKLELPVIEPEWITKDELLINFKNFANRYAFKEREFIFNALYKSEFLDSLCESIGFVGAVHHNLIPSKPLLSNSENILITISNLTTTGGGVYYEIKDIIKMYSGKKVYLMLTDIDNIENLTTEVKSQLSNFNNLTLLFGKQEPEGRLSALIGNIINVKPAKIYHYLGHNNLHAAALIQGVYGKNICVFSFDHGFSLGLDNTEYDAYITKRIPDYEILSKYYHSKVIYIPCCNEDKIGSDKFYKPFNNHKNIITACGAARYYKLHGAGYVDLIVNALKETKGKHLHYGPIEETDLEYIRTKLSEKNIPQDSFIHIPWAENITQSMIENDVDIFIEPFPIVSYKLTLEMHSAGIPTIVKKGNTRLSTTDFIYENSLTWNSENDFVHTLVNLDKSTLEQHSKLARDYYLANHSPDKLLEYFVNEKSFPITKSIRIYDSKLIDIKNVERLLQDEPKRYQKLKLSPLETIFSITNTPDKRHKVITIMGAKLKFRKQIAAIN